MRRLTTPGILAITVALVVLGGLFAADTRTTSGQIPLYSAYGSGLNRFDQVVVWVRNRICGTVIVDTDGRWALPIQISSPCVPLEGDEITFELNGVIAVQTATWKPGGTAADSGYDVEAGIILTLPGEPLPVAATPAPAANTPAAETTVPSGVAPAPPAGGITQVVAGTTDIQALIDAQTFSVESILRWDVATQSFQFFIVGGPTFANSLTTLSATDIVSIKSR